MSIGSGSMGISPGEGSGGDIEKDYGFIEGWGG